MPTEEEAYGDIDVEAFFADYLADHRSEGPSMAAADPGDGVPLENVISVAGGLADHLLWQLHMMDCNQRTLAIAEYIVGNLDEDGFLHVSDEEISAVAGGLTRGDRRGFGHGQGTGPARCRGTDSARVPGDAA